MKKVISIILLLTIVLSFTSCECKHENLRDERTWSTCTESGRYVLTCRDCNQVISAEELPKLTHQYTNGYCNFCNEIDPVLADDIEKAKQAYSYLCSSYEKLNEISARIVASGYYSQEIANTSMTKEDIFSGVLEYGHLDYNTALNALNFYIEELLKREANGTVQKAALLVPNVVMTVTSFCYNTSSDYFDLTTVVSDGGDFLTAKLDYENADNLIKAMSYQYASTAMNHELTAFHATLKAYHECIKIPSGDYDAVEDEVSSYIRQANELKNELGAKYDK